jgi:glycosyltransferase involved in cell wall biosynthesis
MISVMIPTLNDEDYIRDCLKSLERQTNRNFELIVIDGGSADATLKVASEFNARTIVISKGLSRQYNAGVLISKGKILAFTMADTCVPKNWIEMIEKAFLQDARLVALTGPLGIPRNFPLWVKMEYRIWNLIRFLASLMPAALGMFFGSGPNIACRRSAFGRIGGFDEERFGSSVDEDGNLGRRLRQIGRCKFSWRLRVVTTPRWSHLGPIGFTRRYLYILGNVFPFNLFLPGNLWARLRSRTATQIERFHREYVQRKRLRP